MNTESNTSYVFTLLSLIIGGTGTVAAGGITIYLLWWIAPGTHVNLMILVGYQLVISLLTAFLGTILGVLALLSGFGRWKPVVLSVSAIFCSYIPMFAADWIATWIINNHHLILAG